MRKQLTTIFLYTALLGSIILFAHYAVGQGIHTDVGAGFDPLHIILGGAGSIIGTLWAWASRINKRSLDSKDKQIERKNAQIDECRQKLEEAHNAHNTLYERIANLSNAPILNGEGDTVIANSKENNRMVRELHAHTFGIPNNGGHIEYYSGDRPTQQTFTGQPAVSPHVFVPTKPRGKKIFRKEASRDAAFDSMPGEVKYDKVGRAYKYDTHGRQS